MGYTQEVLDSERIHLLRRSFARLETRPVISALVFYRRLFELEPALRPLFTHDIEDQSRKLMEMLSWTLDKLNDLSGLQSALESLGARHVGYGVRGKDYKVVGRALLEMLAEVLGDDLTPATREAWIEFYEMISTTMIKGAQDCAALPASVQGAK